MATMTEDALTLRSLKQAESEAKGVYDRLKGEREQAERELMDRMEGEGMESMRADGTMFSPTRTSYSQVQDRAAFVEWCESVAGDEALIEVKERKALLHELVRERLDNGEPLPPGVGFYVKEYISQRAS